MVIVDLEHISSSSQTVKGGTIFQLRATASGKASGNTFSTVSVFTGAFSISGKFRR
jgi:hypothetical protein